MKEYSIYVAVDKDGIIRFDTEDNNIQSLHNLLQSEGDTENFGYCRVDIFGEMTIRLITVYSTDGIIGQHWQDVDLFYRRLRECEIVHRSSKKSLNYIQNYMMKGWYANGEDEESDVPGDLHTALAQHLNGLLEGKQA